MSSTWVIHFSVFFNLLDFAKPNVGAGREGFDPKVGSIPASRAKYRIESERIVTSKGDSFSLLINHLPCRLLKAKADQWSQIHGGFYLCPLCATASAVLHAIWKRHGRILNPKDQREMSGECRIPLK